MEIKKSWRGRIGKFVDKLSGTKTLYEGASEYAALKVQKKRGTINLISGNKYLQSSYRPGNPPSLPLSLKLRWARRLRRITRPNAFCEGRVKKPTGTVWDYFLVGPLFAPNPSEVKDVCVLGLGVGVAVKLLNRFYKIDKIVGVEIDKVVVDLGRKFFDLNDGNLEIHIQDAAGYVKKSSKKFDLILIDTFKDDAVDPKCSCVEFYLNATKLLKPGGVVLVNRANTKGQEKTNKKFLREFPRLFTQCYALTVRNNVFYFGLQESLEKQKIMERIKNLGFLKDFRDFNISVHGKTLDPHEGLAAELR